MSRSDFDFDDDDVDHRHRRRRPRFCCPYCGTTRPPLIKNRVTILGWIFFLIFLAACFPLAIIGLWITENYCLCSNCRVQIRNGGYS